MIQIWMLSVLAAWLLVSAMEEEYIQLFDHMRKQGCMISSSLEYTHDLKDTGSGMIATKDIGEDELLLKFPLKSCLNALNYFGTELEPVLRKLNAIPALVVILLYEMELGEKSKFAQFFSLLDKHMVPLPRFWSRKELEELQDAVVLQLFMNDKDSIHQEYMATKKALRAVFGSTHKLYVELDRATFDWALGIVQTRSFGGRNGSISLIPVADLTNHHPHNYAIWKILDEGYEFYAYATPQGKQVFFNYAGGELNLRTLGDYGYVPVPNTYNSELFYLTQATTELVSEKELALGEDDNFMFHYQVNIREVMAYFRIASSDDVVALKRKAFSGFRWHREMRAAKLCSSVLRGLIESKPTTIAQDYSLLYNTQPVERLRLAIRFRIGAKTTLLRNLYACDHVIKVVLPCLPQANGLVSRWRFDKESYKLKALAL